jgi:hypothetical protein
MPFSKAFDPDSLAKGVGDSTRPLDQVFLSSSTARDSEAAHTWPLRPQQENER